MTRTIKPNRRLSAGKGKSIFGPASSSLVRLKPVLKQTRGNIKVAVRIRPPTEQESLSTPVVKAVSDSQLIFDPKEEEDGFFFHGVKQTGFRDLNKKTNRNAVFAFDNVFSETATNQDVFELTTKPAIRSVLDGYNCSVFAYGATGAGKTYTMLGTENTPGIVYMTVTELWEQMEALKDTRSYEVAVSYLEIYNELVKDLLRPGDPLNLREDPAAGVIVHGLTFHKPQSSSELLQILKDGNEKRTQHPTDSNKESSRSHAVFQVWLKQRDPNTHTVISVAKLSLIDLAGSERGSATGHTGDRFKEGTNINKSLLALGNCICALAEGRAHIPFRDSKLTRILKDSLGGNCQTVMIAAASPSHIQYEDTYNTLKYADRAKKIKATFVKKVLSPFDLKIAQLESEVETSRAKVEELLAKLKKYESGEITCSQNAETEAQPKWKKSDIEASKKALKRLYQARKDVRLEILKIQSTEKEVSYRMQTRMESLKRCMKISIGGQPDMVAKKAERLEQMLQRKVGVYHAKTAEVLKRLTAVDQSVANYEKKLDATFGEEWPDEIRLYARVMQVECRNCEMNEKILHMEKLMAIREQAGNEDQEQIFTCLEMIQTYYLLMRSGGLISQYQELQFEKFVASLERDVGIIWEADVNNIDKDMARLSVGLTQVETSSNLAPPVTVNGNTTEAGLDDTTVSGVNSPIPPRFARVNDSFAIRKDVRPVQKVELNGDRSGGETEIAVSVKPVKEVELNGDRSVGETEIAVSVKPVKEVELNGNRSVGETEISVPAVSVKAVTEVELNSDRSAVSVKEAVAERGLRDITNTVPVSNDDIPTISGHDEMLNGTITVGESDHSSTAVFSESSASLDTTIVVSQDYADLDHTVVMPTVKRSASDRLTYVLPVIETHTPVAMEIPCKPSLEVKRPIVPVRTIRPDSEAEKENSGVFKMPAPSRPFKSKEADLPMNRGLKRVPSTVSRSTSSLLSLKTLPVEPKRSPLITPRNRLPSDATLTPLLGLRGKSVSTSKLNKS